MSSSSQEPVPSSTDIGNSEQTSIDEKNVNSDESSTPEFIEGVKLDPIPMTQPLTQSVMGDIVMIAGSRKPEEALNGVFELYKRNQEIEIMKTKNYLENEKDARKSFHFSLIIGLLAFVAILLFSAYTKDKELPDRVVTLLFGAAGGGGSAVLLTRKSQDQK